MKKPLILLLALVLLVCLAACDSAETPTAPQSSSGTQPTVPEATDHIHRYTEVTTAPTCTHAGFATFTCICGDTYTGRETAALGHAWGQWITTQEPTEDAAGSAERTCSTCQEKETTVLAQLVHTHQYTEVLTAPTCESNGYTTFTCTCGHSYTGKETAAQGHSWGQWVTLQAPTETTEGSAKRTCPICQASETKVLAVLGHNHQYTSFVTAPTCTSRGYTTYSCRCGDSYTDNYVAATGHSYEEITVNATCTTVGSKTYVCHCGDNYGWQLPTIPHSYEAVITPPTCTQPGYTTYTCACSHSYTGGSVPATGHSYQAVITPPTCTQSGYTTYTCHCANTYKDTYVPATGHSFDGQWVHDSQYHWKEATCQHTGEIGHKAEHSFVNGICSLCQYSKIEKLATPTVTKVEYDTIHWTPVENADTYTVLVNDNYELTLRGTSCDLADVAWNGRHISNYGYVRITVQANGHGDFSASDRSAVFSSYFYMPETDPDTAAMLASHSIGYGYNLIEDDYLDVTKCSAKSVFNVAKLLTVSTYTSRPHSAGEGTSYSYSSMDEFLTKNQLGFEYGQTTGCMLIGSLKMQINADIGLDYRKYEYNKTYIYEYNLTYKDHMITNVTDDNLLVYCLSDEFVKDVKGQSSATVGMTPAKRAQYIFDTYGTHAILGITTGGTFRARYTVSTNERSVAAAIDAAFQLSTGGGGAIDQIIQKDLNIGLNIKNQNSWKSESTEAHFKVETYGGQGSATAGNVESAISQWAASMSESNARSVKFTKEGAVALESLIAFLDPEVEAEFKAYVDLRADQIYNELYNKFTKTVKNYSIVFDANGGTGSTKTMDCSYEETYNLSANAFTRRGWKFIGWSTDPNATTAQFTDKQAICGLEKSGTVTLYAVWGNPTTYSSNTYYFSDWVSSASGSNADKRLDWGDSFDIAYMQEQGYKVKLTVSCIIREDRGDDALATMTLEGCGHSSTSGEIKVSKRGTATLSHSLQMNASDLSTGTNSLYVLFDSNGKTIFDAINVYILEQMTVTIEFYK